MERVDQQLQAHLHNFDNQQHFWILYKVYPFWLLVDQMLYFCPLLFLQHFCNLVSQIYQGHDLVTHLLHLVLHVYIWLHSTGLFLEHFLYHAQILVLCLFDLNLSFYFFLKDLMRQLCDLQLFFSLLSFLEIILQVFQIIMIMLHHLESFFHYIRIYALKDWISIHNLLFFTLQEHNFHEFSCT